MRMTCLTPVARHPAAERRHRVRTREGGPGRGAGARRRRGVSECPMRFKGLECPVSKLVNIDTRPRPTIGDCHGTAGEPSRRFAPGAPTKSASRQPDRESAWNARIKLVTGRRMTAPPRMVLPSCVSQLLRSDRAGGRRCTARSTTSSPATG